MAQERDSVQEKIEQELDCSVGFSNKVFRLQGEEEEKFVAFMREQKGEELESILIGTGWSVEYIKGHLGPQSHSVVI